MALRAGAVSRWNGEHIKEDPVRGTTSAQRADQLGAVSDGHGPDMGGDELIMKAPADLDVPELLTTAEVAALLKVNRSTLSRWRSVGIGPESRGSSANIPRYQRADVVEWLRRAVGLTIRKLPSGQMVRCAEVRPSVRQRAHVRHEAGRAGLAHTGARRRWRVASIRVPAGRRCGRLLPIWLEERQHAVSAKTYSR